MSAPRPSTKRLNTGYKPSPVDARDYRYGALAAPSVTPPAEYYFEEACEFPLPVYDQGSVPSCVGWSLAMLKTAQERVEHKRTYSFDGAEIYKPIALPEGGAYVRQGLQLLVDTGSVPTGMKRPYKIQAYASIAPKSHDEVKHAMATTGVLELGFEVPRFFLGKGGKEFDAGNGGADDEIVGGHAIVATAYRPDGIQLHNSWGARWGANGRAWVSWEFWDKYVMECWSSIDIKDPATARRLAKARQNIDKVTRRAR